MFAGARKKDNKQVAIKIFWKAHDVKTETVVGKKVPSEVIYMQKVSHIPGCISLLDCYQSEEGLTMVMERPADVEDMKRYMRRKSMTEPKAKLLFKQMVETTIEIHRAGIIHGDIKLENILITRNKLEIKFIDFGNALNYQEEEYSEFYGTPIYAPPEWLTHRSYRAEPMAVWALGVALFTMLQSYYPFKTNEDTLKGKLFYKRKLSRQLKDLLSKCLNVDEAQRIKLEDILDHPWMKSECKTTVVKD